MSSDEITYEQPLNELVRTCLRLEQLFLQIDNLLSSADSDQFAHLLTCHIIYLLNILDRPDLKSKFSQEFNRYIEHFSKLKYSPKISKEKLQKTLNQLEHLKSYFLNLSGKLGSDLRENDFMSQIRLNLLSHSGGSFIDAPAYYRWLQWEPAEKKQQTILQWMLSFQDIRSAMQLMLDIVRNSSEPQKVVADKGFYHQTLNPQLPCQLIRISLSKTLPFYPEISAGRHRLSLRFMMPSIKERSQQTEENVKFKLTCCIV
jgi:cell division protein ZapD